MEGDVEEEAGILEERWEKTMEAIRRSEVKQ